MYICEVDGWQRLKNESFLGRCTINYVPGAGIAPCYGYARNGNMQDS